MTESAANTPRYTSRILSSLVRFIEEEYGEEVFHRFADLVMKYDAGLIERIQTDDFFWVSRELVEQVYQHGMEATRDGRLAYHIGNWVIVSRQLSNINRKLKAAPNLQRAYELAAEVANHYNRNVEVVEYKKTGRHSCRLDYRRFQPVHNAIFNDYAVGIYTALPVLMGYAQADARVSVKKLPNSEELTSIDVSWIPNPNYTFWGILGGGFLGLLWLPLCFVMPLILIWTIAPGFFIFLGYYVGRKFAVSSHWKFDRDVMDAQTELAAGDQAQLRRHIRELRELRDTLEDRVEEATRELLEQNQKLQSAHDEMMRSQEKLIHSEKLAGIGQLAGGVAHEFNNILAGMQGYAELALPNAENKRVEKALHTVLASTQRARRIVLGLLAFSKKAPPAFESVNLREVLRSAWHLLKADLRKAHITVMEEYEDVPAILGDPGQLQQVFLNLIMNAKHALEGAGQRSITLRLHRKGDYAVASVLDTGTGISREALPHIFEPFYTSRHGRKRTESLGTGLGLSISHGIIERHHGHIEVESELDVGSAFRIYLPLEMPSPETERRALIDSGRTAMDRAKLTGRILVVDDEPMVRDVVCQMLEFDGFQVRSASEGKSAIAMLQREHFDLLLLDVMMPGMNGPDVFLTVKQSHETLPVVMMTGQVGDELAEIAGVMEQFADVTFLRKPFLHADLMAAVQGALTRKES